MLAKATGVIMTTRKLKILGIVSNLFLEIYLNRTYQLAEVDSALVGARIRSGTISAGYNQVIPSQPMAKNVLNTNRNTA